MKVVSISKHDRQPRPAVVQLTEIGGRRTAFVGHGESGHKRWLLRYVVENAIVKFPRFILKIEDDLTSIALCPTCGHKEKPNRVNQFCMRHSFDFPDGDYRLIPVGADDPKGNAFYRIGKSNQGDDKQFLVMWHLSPGYEGSAAWSTSGDCEVIGKGVGKAKGGVYDCPTVLVKGPSMLQWTRTGDLYGEAANWIAAYDGNVWFVGPRDEWNALGGWYL